MQILSLLIFPALLINAEYKIPQWDSNAATFEQRVQRGENRQRNEGECHLSKDNSCLMKDMPEEHEVVSVYPGGETKCMDSTSPYRFLVFPGRTDRVLIYFQGGGACWNKFSTTTVSLCTQRAEEKDEGSFGIFERREPSNPFRDWTIVYLLYCSGDFHSGHATFTYSDDKKIHQRGAVNVESALNWIKNQNWAPEKLLLMGSSAGSIGLQSFAGAFLTELKYKNAALILDSCFVIDSQHRFYRGMFQKFHICENKFQWNWNPQLLKKCKTGELSMDQVFIETMKAFPHVTFASVNSKVDWVQRFFYLANMKTILTKKRYYMKLSAQMREYAKQPNFVAYLVNGEEHQLTDYHELYSTYTTGPNKHKHLPKTPGGDAIPLLNWMGKLPLDPNTTIATQCQGRQVSNLKNLKPTYCDIALMKTKVSYT